MAESKEREEIRSMVMTTFRPAFRNVMEHMRDGYGMKLHEIVVDLQLSVIFNYERMKLNRTGIEYSRLEYQEVAVLDLIKTIAQEMAYAQ